MTLRDLRWNGLRSQPKRVITGFIPLSSLWRFTLTDQGRSKEGAAMATIDTENLAKGLQQVEACWQAYTSSQRLVEGLEGSDLSSAIEAANRDFTRFQNQCQLFYAEVRKRAADADKLESDMALYPHYFQ
ncbi:hypothetical protein [Pseudomonas hunanensis]|uniref:hypothetical protein n=1 Tax=Pseudomonas hunanensis TaxID=1247546 RepID=UPI001FD9AD61|nr:hypothetical protein [Pseudomonas sp. BP7]